ncbi:hypothetical protein GWI33_016661 [Rhynchophorus ferrugineus]|uniref:Uncharacterized protein n=1 Tax=Rhynchophorus ferrugineus TaxID=354439 RepID=A0A834M349_RHYFE|nr:hypothetical protein GWI33_016661 [Rhynchophorus ferrugineus]
MTASKALKIISWSANSIRDKNMELELFLVLFSSDIDIAPTQETFLKSSRRFFLLDYTVHRNDFVPTCGSETAILAKKAIKRNLLLSIVLSPNIESTSIRVKTHDGLIDHPFLP